MIGGIGWPSIYFLEPQLLWFLLVPGLIFLLWAWRLVLYRRDAVRFRRRRLLPIRERLSLFGGLLFWLGVIAACALAVVALARPAVIGSAVNTSAVDLIVLQDGSASMHVTDVDGDRWQRSMKFLRVLAQTLRWNNDRLALATFAHIAAPQVRLTKDPNTFFFFLDHLDRESPFPLQNDTTWDTNIEVGIHWGIRLFEKDREVHGPSANAAGFLLISDGQAWSGKVENAIKDAVSQEIPIHVVGVGTQSGGLIPNPGINSELEAPIHSSLDRASLLAIASAGNGNYVELDRESDREIAARVIDSLRSRAKKPSIQQTAQNVYWPVLFAIACVTAMSLLVVQDVQELWLHAGGAGLALMLLWLLTN
jgi:Ca-activated chloride channel family protein